MPRPTSDALFLPSANWYCSQLGAWGHLQDASSLTYFLAYGCKSRVAIYKVDLSPEGTFSPPQFVADMARGKHDKKVTSVTFIHGTYSELLLVCAGEEGSIQIWNALTLELVDHHKKHKTAEVMAISSKDDNVIVGGDRTGVLSVWTRSSGHIGLHTPIPSDCIYSIAVCPQRKHHVAVGYRSGKLLVLDIMDGSIVARLKGHDEEVHAVQWRPNATTDSPVLASSSRDKRIRMWDGTSWEDAQMLHEWTLPRPKKNISTHQLGRLWLTFCWIPSSNYGIVCSSVTGDMLRFEWTPNQKKVSAPTVFKHSHTRLIFNIVPLVVSRTNVLLLSISMDRDVRLTHLASMECHAKLVGLGGHVYALQRHPKSAVVAGGIGDQTIRVIDLTKPELSSQLLWKGLQSKVTAVAWHPILPSLLAYGTEEGHIGLYNVQSQDHTRFKTHHGGMVRQVHWIIERPTTPANDTADVWMKSLESIENGDVALDEATLDTAAPSTSCVLWSCDVDGAVYASNPDTPEANSININKRLSVPKVTCVAWHADASTGAIGTPEGAVALVTCQSSASWTTLHSYYDHSKPVTALAWCVQSSLLATASTDASICVYALQGGAVSPMQHRLTGHGGGITCLDWSASGAFLASASLDGTVQVWKVGHTDGFNFREHCGRVLAVTWVDDTKLVSGGEDQTIRKWAFADQVHSMPPKPKPTAEATPISKSTAATPKKKDHKTVVMKAASTMFHQQSGLAADIGNAQPVTDFLRDEQDLYEAEGDVEASGRVLLLQGRIGEALRLVARHGKLGPTWLMHAPLAGLDMWREYTRLYANQCREKRDFCEAVLAFLSIGEVYAAIECFVKGNMWLEALKLIELRCAPADPIVEETKLLYVAHLKSLEKWSEAGQFLQSLSLVDQACACYLHSNDALGLALDLMDPMTTSAMTLMDTATRAILGCHYDVAQRAVDMLSSTPHRAEALLLQVYVFYIQEYLSPMSSEWNVADTALLWSLARDGKRLVSLPWFLQDLLRHHAPKSENVWSRIILCVQSLDGVDDIEDSFGGGRLDDKFTKLMEANATTYCVGI
ncbi:hypothetical protein, variant [Aphanomyces invadans]|uniref:Gem-associated protein 5 TPR domain-containing protein n=1 Tax=Aphanomyces invadans TaxID=157072 RepID=A0A024TD36_9STRA|nr:hypothetical protein, variant [Aphanomyces invadans]ETV91496.1 hypothetical protein, variant [Aphanomyces invadans]|eukprot:XP_008879948.1 hypothetical protein, variant [Aphanomyces invadans]